MQGACAVELQGEPKPGYCALVCNLASPLPRQGCPGGGLYLNFEATCERVETIGLCMYGAKAGRLTGAERDLGTSV